MTMKVLCISKWAKAPSAEERDAILPKEVPATLKLYLNGVIEQMWFKLDAPGVVFLVNAESVDAAKTHVHGLPMGQAGLMDFDFIPVGPLAPLGLLRSDPRRRRRIGRGPRRTDWPRSDVTPAYQKVQGPLRRPYAAVTGDNAFNTCCGSARSR
ncbi:MAG TPA: hypothetical protein VHY34_05775 [Caulobacteraceae bacterium]|jgi:hypothetical protein|nr:hypothetical protein [Caulobacteraceae bacterium]